MRADSRLRSCTGALARATGGAPVLTAPCRNAYNMVMNKHGLKLYEGVRDTITEHLLEMAIGIKESTDDQLLDRICDVWNVHSLHTAMLADILMYMVRARVRAGREPRERSRHR